MTIRREQILKLCEFSFERSHNELLMREERGGDKGFSDGSEHENARLAPLLALLGECAEALDLSNFDKGWDSPLDVVEKNRKVLTKLQAALDEMEKL